MVRTSLSRCLPLIALAGLLACSSSDETATNDDDLTSITARSRELKFEGVVYVEPDATDEIIQGAVRTQTQSAFGPLLHKDIGVNSRELAAIDPRTFKRRKVTMFDTNKADDAGKPLLEVKYTYTDNAVVPVALSRRSSLPLALLGPGSQDD